MIHHAELPSWVLETQSFLIHMTLTEGQSETLTPFTCIVRQTKSRHCNWLYNSLELWSTKVRSLYWLLHLSQRQIFMKHSILHSNHKSGYYKLSVSVMAHQRHYFHTMLLQSIISIPITSTSVVLDSKKSSSSTSAHLQIPSSLPCETLIRNSVALLKEKQVICDGVLLFTSYCSKWYKFN